jgi:hypothetical protein
LGAKGHPTAGHLPGIWLAKWSAKWSGRQDSNEAFHLTQAKQRFAR